MSISGDLRGTGACCVVPAAESYYRMPVKRIAPGRDGLAILGGRASHQEVDALMPGSFDTINRSD